MSGNNYCPITPSGSPKLKMDENLFAEWCDCNSKAINGDVDPSSMLIFDLFQETYYTPDQMIAKEGWQTENWQNLVEPRWDKRQHNWNTISRKMHYRCSYAFPNGRGISINPFLNKELFFF